MKAQRSAIANIKSMPKPVGTPKGRIVKKKVRNMAGIAGCLKHLPAISLLG